VTEVLIHAENKHTLRILVGKELTFVQSNSVNCGVNVAGDKITNYHLIMGIISYRQKY
jgi:hypothetical protein